jgi:hypothetical protein
MSLFFRDGIFWFLAVFSESLAVVDYIFDNATSKAVAFPHMMICWVARPTLNEVMIGYEPFVIPLLLLFSPIPM